ncbi:low molecular weight protein tyrosine phosphatase family protein [Croceicoccus marinus]|uniref:Phosphotyrosine protein phosphatase n=1 Tax=Croceicoccus marinus TaxID=450378 RepID=A0A7G6VT87_9SPHN|nr:low molecular weight protein tyrosine phosphatase family protein [Croceicoccus marinus]QNE04952.1 phosphotyrosine protein phosphatase [Croceicoccus marinus]
MKKVLFVCSQNRLRSPTAEQIFADHPGIEVSSAGTNADADNPLTPELVRWADMIFVMERTHREKLQRRFRGDLKSARIICLSIPDDYAFMDDGLVRLLRAKVGPHLPWKQPYQVVSGFSLATAPSPPHIRA